MNVDSLQLTPAMLGEKAAQARARGQQIVAVQGLGFVGLAVAAAVAGAVGTDGHPAYFVIGVDLPFAADRIAQLNRGETPIHSPDPELPRLISQAHAVGNLLATSLPEAYSLADVIVVDINLDVVNRNVARPDEIDVDMKRFADSVAVVGRQMKHDALVLVETTVPIGTCEKVLAPVLQKERDARGIREPLLLAHAYERVTPGPRYIQSIRSLYRTYSATSERAAERAQKFLASFIDTEKFPLRRLENPVASEMAKILENSYRAANIAFIQEWTLLAEDTGVNLFEVIDSICVRKGTHDNMRRPGFGVGGYCLTKDSYLAQWGARNLFESSVTLDVTLQALAINYQMPLHSLKRLAELLDGRLRGAAVALCGISYLPDVGDTRYSPSELFYDELVKAGAKVRVHDPCVRRWQEKPDVLVTADLHQAISAADAVVFAVSHRDYLALDPGSMPKKAGRTLAVLDATNIFDDRAARILRDAGCRVAGIGKGHWRKLGYHLSA